MTEIIGRQIGPEHPPYFVADIGANHDGDIDRAYALIDLAAQAGADAVKFQNFRAETIVSRRGFTELGKMAHQATWTGTVYDAYEAAALSLSWTNLLADRAKRAGVAFMTTPYDLELVDLIDPYVPAWKIGSGDITYLELVRHVASKGKPVFLATGASTAEEVDAAVGAYLEGTSGRDPVEYGQSLVLMQCNTNYTGDPNNIRHSNLRVLNYWRDNYYALLGLSDHTPGPIAVTAAIALGACVVEKHFTDDRSRKGPDHAFALEPQQWRLMIGQARVAWSALGDGRKKVEANEAEARIVQRRALRYRCDLLAGQNVTDPDLIATRPCPEGALEPYRIGEVSGRTLQRDVVADTLVRLGDLE